MANHGLSARWMPHNCFRHCQIWATSPCDVSESGREGRLRRKRPMACPEPPLTPEASLLLMKHCGNHFHFSSLLEQMLYLIFFNLTPTAMRTLAHMKGCVRACAGTSAADAKPMCIDVMTSQQLGASSISCYAVLCIFNPQIRIFEQ